MKDISVEKLIEWLGRDGAIAGLEASDITVPEFCDLAVRCGFTLDKKARRRDIIIELVNRDAVRIDKTPEELLTMRHEELVRYFEEKKVSRTELLGLVSQFGIRIGQ